MWFQKQGRQQTLDWSLWGRRGPLPLLQGRVGQGGALPSHPPGSLVHRQELWTGSWKPWVLVLVLFVAVTLYVGQLPWARPRETERESAGTKTNCES